MKNPVPAQQIDYRELQKIYNEMLSIAALLDEHHWSRSMTNRDLDVIGQARKRLGNNANNLYLATHIEADLQVVLVDRKRGQ